MDAKQLGSFIAEQRKRLGYTQAQLAEKLHVTDKAVSRWERGVGLPDLSNIEPLADTLQITLVELMQAKLSTKETFTAQEAEIILTDTLQFSSKISRTAMILDHFVLAVFFLSAAFFLAVLGFNGKTVLLSVGSLLTGLGAWGIPLWVTSVSRKMKPAGATLCSLGLALLSLTLQFFDLAQEVYSRDFAAVEDTIYVLLLVVILFVSVTLVLNIRMILTRRQKHPTM